MANPHIPPQRQLLVWQDGTGCRLATWEAGLWGHTPYSVASQLPKPTMLPPTLDLRRFETHWPP